MAGSKCISVIAPRASIVYPEYPAAVSASYPFTTFAIEKALLEALGQAPNTLGHGGARSPFYVLFRRQLRPENPHLVEAESGGTHYYTYYRGGEWIEVGSNKWQRSLEETECTFPMFWHSNELLSEGAQIEARATENVECSYVVSGTGQACVDGRPEAGKRARFIPLRAQQSIRVEIVVQGNGCDGD